MKDLQNMIKLLVSIVGCELAGLLATPVTMEAIPTWYVTLNKPFFAPPNWLFGPVWTTLYLLMGIALYLVWQQGWKKKQVRWAMTVFLLQLFFNFTWSLAFFGLRSPLAGLVNIILLIGLILWTMKEFKPLSKTAFYLLVPYLAWVGFATALNAAIWWGN